MIGFDWWMIALLHQLNFTRLLPDVFDSAHVTVDIQGHNILEIVQWKCILYIVNDVLPFYFHIKDIISNQFLNSFLLFAMINHFNSIFITFVQNKLQQFSHSLYFLEIWCDSHRAIHCQISKSWCCSVFVKFITNFTVDAEAEVITETFADNFPFKNLVFLLWYLVKSAMIINFCMDMPNV